MLCPQRSLQGDWGWGDGGVGVVKCIRSYVLLSDVNREMDVGLHGLGAHLWYSRSYQRYTVHERALYFNATLLVVDMM